LNWRITYTPQKSLFFKRGIFDWFYIAWPLPACADGRKRVVGPTPREVAKFVHSNATKPTVKLQPEHLIIRNAKPTLEYSATPLVPVRDRRHRVPRNRRWSSTGVGISGERVPPPLVGQHHSTKPSLEHGAPPVPRVPPSSQVRCPQHRIPSAQRPNSACHPPTPTSANKCDRHDPLDRPSQFPTPPAHAPPKDKCPAWALR